MAPLTDTVSAEARRLRADRHYTHEPTGYTHDEVSTDKRNPTVNAYGRIYGSMELSKDYTPVLDPMTGNLVGLLTTENVAEMIMVRVALAGAR